MKLLNCIDLLLSEVLLSISCFQTYQKFTPSINIHLNHSSMLLIEPSIKSQKESKSKPKCLKLMLKERLLSLKLKSDQAPRKQRKKILNNKKLNKLNNKNLYRKKSQQDRVKRNKVQKDKSLHNNNNHQHKRKNNQWNRKSKTKHKSLKEDSKMLRNLFPQDR